MTRKVILTEAELKQIIESATMNVIQEGFASNVWNGVKSAGRTMYGAAKRAAGKVANGVQNAYMQGYEKSKMSDTVKYLKQLSQNPNMQNISKVLLQAADALQKQLTQPNNNPQGQQGQQQVNNAPQQQQQPMQQANNVPQQQQNFSTNNRWGADYVSENRKR